MCDKSFSEFKIQIFRTCTKTSADLIKVKSKSSSLKDCLLPNSICKNNKKWPRNTHVTVKSPKTYTFHAWTRPMQRNKSILAIVYLMTRKLFVISSSFNLYSVGNNPSTVASPLWNVGCFFSLPREKGWMLERQLEENFLSYFRLHFARLKSIQ